MPQIPQSNSNKHTFVRIMHGRRYFVALPNERYWDRHGFQCDFRFQCTPDPGSVIHGELQRLLIELKLKTSNNVTKWSNCSIKNDPIIIKMAKNYASIIYEGLAKTPHEVV